MSIQIHQLTSADVELMTALLTIFGNAFNDVSTYTVKQPSDAYLRRLLGNDSFLALAALHERDVIGGIAAYQLMKFEQERSEIYIYDLAVAAPYRRQGVATALIEALQKVAIKRGAYLMFVQADTGIDDQAAIALYTKLGTREEVLNFDIPISAESDDLKN